MSDSALTSLSVQNQGSLIAVGDSDGVITLLQLCDSLTQPGPNEKNVIGTMFDRETKREKNLDLIKKQNAGMKKPDGEEGATAKPTLGVDEKEYITREKSFFNEVGMTGDDLGTTLVPGRGGGEK